MKKNILRLSIIAATFCLSNVSNAGETLGTYEMQVTGTVISASSCLITAPNSLYFDIKDIHDIHYSSQGPQEHAQLYPIEISGCKKGMHVSATVVGDSDTSNSELLSTHSETAGSAQNVAIGFYEQTGYSQHPLVALNSGHTTSRDINELGNAQIAIQADVVLADDHKFATAGTISANANVQINFL
jgi:type 1 fimbria pilin